jgi:multiple sugar transport system substrate-binding protein
LLTNIKFHEYTGFVAGLTGRPIYVLALEEVKMVRKILIDAIVVSLVLMAGCGGKKEGSSAPAGNETVEVTFWDMVVGGDNYPGEAINHALKISQKHPNIKIKYQSIPWANRYETFATAIASKEAPDFSTGGGYQSFQFAGAGEILDVGSIVDEWRADGTLGKYQIDMINYFQFKGVQVGIPWNYEPRYMLYRADWFEAAGIEPPKTWDDIYNAAVRFTDKSQGIYGLAYPTSGSSGNVLWNIWWATNGGGIWTPDGKNLDWTNPKNEEAMVFLRKLRDAGVFPEGMASYESNEVVQLAAQGKAAMVALVGGNSGTQLGDAGLAGKFKVLPVFAGPSANGDEGYVAAINALMAYKQTKHPEQTKQAMKWWAENMYDLWTNKTASVNGIPVRNDWLADATYQSTITDPFMADVIKITLPKTHTLIYPATNISGWLTQNAFDGERWWTGLSQATLIDPRSPKELLQDWQTRAVKMFTDFAE